MAEQEKAKASQDQLPTIGQLIERDTGIPYDSYSADQQLGRSERKPYNGVEASVAAIINHPEIAGKVYDLLKYQADLRTAAVADDMNAILDGKTLGGLPPLPMVNGRVQVGALFMSDRPKIRDVAREDRVKLVRAEAVLDDPRWLVAEGASNISNAMRDAEVNINGKSLTDKQKKTITKGMQAEQELEHALVTGTHVSWIKRILQERKVEKAMDTAAQAANIAKDDPVYQHYRKAMHNGIDKGLKAIDKEKKLHTAAVEDRRAQQATPSIPQ